LQELTAGEAFDWRCARVKSIFHGASRIGEIYHKTGIVGGTQG
jgi:hypothetical protein